MIPRISRNAVKEGFDTLPAAICYFDRNGLLRLINHRMQEISAVLCGRDLQTLTDLEQSLHSPGGGVQLRDEAARIYAFPDGTVYHFAVRPVQDKYGIPYTEVMATDVTRLAALHAALQQENERLADANRRAKRLYDNMPDIVREEEILKMKMRVHDDIGHRHRQLHRRAEGQAFAGKVGHGITGEEDDLAQHQRKHEQCCHRQLVEPAQIGDAHRDPEDDQCADHQTPDPAADVKDTADSQCAVIDHDSRPADKLQHIQKGEQQAALLAEAHLDGLHSAAAGAAADQACQQHHGAADDMSDKDSCQPLGHAQRGKGRARQNFRQRNTGTEPDQAVLKGRCLFHSVNSPFNANI